VALPESKPK
jgi:hypothetical protein